MNDRTYGVLRLTLRPTAYDWRFLAVAGVDLQRSRLGQLPIALAAGQDPRRRARDDRTGTDVAGDDGSGADDRARAHPDATEDDGARAEGRAALDDDLQQLPVLPRLQRPLAVVARGYLSLTNMTPCPTNTSSSTVTPSQTKVWLWTLQRAPIARATLDLDERADSRLVADRAAVEIGERADDDIDAEIDVVQQSAGSVVDGLTGHG